MLERYTLDPKGLFKTDCGFAKGGSSFGYWGAGMWVRTLPSRWLGIATPGLLSLAAACGGQKVTVSPAAALPPADPVRVAAAAQPQPTETPESIATPRPTATPSPSPAVTGAPTTAAATLPSPLLPSMNGDLAPPEADVSFSIDVYISPEENPLAIAINATSIAGDQQSVVRTVISIPVGRPL